MSVKVVVLDVFGTLLKFTPKYHKKPYKQIYVKSNYVNKRLCDPCIFNYNLKQYAEAIDIQLSLEELHDLNNDLQDEVNHIQLFPEVREFLDILFQKNIEVCIASNLAVEYNEIVKRMGFTSIENHFFSNQLNYKKPDWRFFRHIDNYLNAKGFEKSEILMIGDNFENDYEGAKSFGWNALHLNRTGKKYLTVDSISKLNSAFMVIK